MTVNEPAIQFSPFQLAGHVVNTRIYFVCTLLLSQPAIGQVDVFIDLDPSPGIQDTLVANPGDSVEATIVLNVGASGLRAYGISVEFDSEELNLGSPVASEFKPSGFSFNLSSGVESFIEDRGDGIGNVLTFEAANLSNGPVNSSFSIGSINFEVIAPANQISDIDIVPGLFNTVFDGLIGNNSSPISVQAFHGASIKAVAAPGDFNGDSIVDASDIDDLTAAVKSGTNSINFDLNSDLVVDQRDRQIWIRDLANTSEGDVNLDGSFESSDLNAIFVAGQYDDQIAGNSTWASGDWNGDCEFDSADLIVAFRSGAYETSDAIAEVPEPKIGFLAGVVFSSIFITRRRIAKSIG